MSREEIHKLLDKVLDTGYCGEFVLNCFKGSISNIQLGQTVKNVNEVMMVTVG